MGFLLKGEVTGSIATSRACRIANDFLASRGPPFCLRSVQPVGESISTDLVDYHSIWLLSLVVASLTLDAMDCACGVTVGDVMEYLFFIRLTWLQI